MKLGEKQSTIKNKVFDGAYSVLETPIDPELQNFWKSLGINPTGITGIFVKYSSGNKNIESGAYPFLIYDNKSSRPSVDYVSGASEFGDLSGYLYYRMLSPIFGTCHGFGHDSGVWFSGYNFYNAFHPEGYISPPFGQNISVYKGGEYGVGALYQVGSCSNLGTTEYNDLFGIVSTTAKGVENSAENLISDTDSFINSPAIVCPQDLSVAFYWREKQYKLIAGTAASITANAFLNSNPIPISLDFFDIKTLYRYSSTGTYLGMVENGEGQFVKQTSYKINYQNGKPVPGYGSFVNQQRNPLLNGICFGIFTEGELTTTSTQTNSLLVIAADSLGNLAKSTFDYFVWWNSWHFLFKENSDGFPFSNDYKLASEGGGDYLGLAKTPNTANYGSQLFKAELSDPDHYWENRQCPGIVDFLPYTFGGSIYACPSYHFDVPYYAVLNKFGFYGTRFFNGCVRLNLAYPSSGYPQRGGPNAIELPGDGYSYTYPDEEEPDEDEWTNYDDNIYDNLLKIAKNEELNNDFFALNKLFFLWANIDYVKQSPEFIYLKNKYSFFDGMLQSFIGEFDSIFPNGKTDLLYNKNWFQSEESKLFFDKGSSNTLLQKNINYKLFLNQITKSISSQDIYYWNLIEKNYANVILKGQNTDTGFYDLLEKSKNERFQNRYYENFIRGNPVDLYPSNKITFGFDSAKKFIDSYSWGKSIGKFSPSMKFEDPDLNRRYFVGAYAESLDFVGYSDYIKSINSQIENSSFYPGYFNSTYGQDFIKEEYLPVIIGNAFSGENINKNTIINKKNILQDGWLALGYGGITKLKDLYSCFTPIFIQQPLHTVHCKIGQSPTFRSLAVDYHTIPEDKINIRYPEIKYWTKKLKIVDSKYKNRYPLSYKWFRIKKSDCNYNFENFLTNGYFATNTIGDYFHNPNGAPPLEPSNPNGEWCCLEGDGPNCTLIHPKECEPKFNPNGSWSSKYEGTPGFEEAKRNNFYMKFKKGAKKNKDDEYFYFCMVKGRFGIRISQASELFIDDLLKFDVSIQNAGNAEFPLPITFDVRDENGQYLTISPINKVGRYAGFHNDPIYIPENVVQQQIPPPNRGFGDVYSYKFVGTWGYGGALQSYSPGTLDDTRGLKETWGRFLHYGSLIKYEKKLTQKQGDLIYGVSHLPVCVSGEIINNQRGVRLALDSSSNDGTPLGVIHWANMQSPTVSTNGRVGVIWNKIGNAGELYNPASYFKNGAFDTSPSPGLGQWQWGNNLGTIHRFGYKSPNNELNTSPGTLTDAQKNELKDKILKYSLDGPSCGWNKYGLGRNMLNWIEGFSSFYIFCDPLKKKNVTNYNYMSPALRQTNSSIQYFWLGKPSNTYLKRYPMHGPYAYQWKVMPHNRDRNGNGMSEGFYSYGWGTNYSLMYDAPAIYGLFRKYKEPTEEEKDYINKINIARAEVFGRKNQLGVRYTRFGFTNGEGGAVRYGNVWIGNKNSESAGGNALARGYVNSGEILAISPKFSLYGCDDSDLKNGDCFDACLSIRYPFGFLPGGKVQKLTPAMPSGEGYNLVANNVFTGGDFHKKTFNLSGTFFRGPFGTPHHVYLSSIGKDINGISPCSDGGADHCNYMTPTINLGSSCYLSSEIPTMVWAVTQANASIDYPLPF